MTGEPDIQSIDSHDEEARRAAVRLLAASVPAECQGLVAYHASGCAAFLAAALSPPPGQRTVCLRAARVAGEVIAVADWRMMSAQLFLNGISVRAQYRGHGYGSRLLDDGVRIARDLGIPALGLDVAVDNVGAYALYQKWGFEEMGYSWWENVAREAAGPARVPVRILDWPTFDAQRTAYGFGDLSVRHAGQAGGAGQLTKVRTVGSVMRVEPGATGALIAHALSELLVPSRVYSVRAGSSAGPASPWFARFVRMRMSLRGAGRRPVEYGERRSARSPWRI
jgi:ribosomal protein S18 acetylase RimI-like enzyme